MVHSKLLKGKKVLVAGGTGFLGSCFTRRLLENGCQVRATHFARDPSFQNPNLQWLRADLTKAEECRKAVEGIDYVFQCAANTSGAAVMVKSPLSHVTPNLVMNAQLLDASYQAGVKRWVYMSSSAAYPPTDERPVKEDEMMVGDPYPVYYAVGWMKRSVEILCRTYAEKIPKPMSTLIIRPSNVYGEHDKFDPEKSHVTASMVRKVAERLDPVPVWGKGDEVRDLIHIDDFLDGSLLAFDQDLPFLAINIAAGKGHSVREVLQFLLEADGRPDAKVQYDPTKPTTIPIRLVDCSLAKRMLGFEAKIPLAEGLARALNWYRQNYKK